MNKKDNNTVIKNYFRGKGTLKDARRAIGFLTNYENEDESRRITGQLWQSEWVMEGDTIDKDSLLGKIHHKINLKERFSSKNEMNKLQLIWHHFSRVAALLFIPLFTYLLWQQVKLNTPEMIRYAEVYVHPGGQMRYVLPDSSIVWLNNSSKLRFPMAFNGDFREVELEGEAFFKVRKNTKQPFIVTSGDIEVKVLGTEFNVMGYADSWETEVALLEGKVALYTGDTNARGEFLTELKPGELAGFNKAKKRLTIKKDDVAKRIAWIEGKLVFMNCSLDEAAKKIARWYNCDVVLSEPELSEYTITGTFDGENLKQMLDLMVMAMPVEYQLMKARRIMDETFSKRKIIFSLKK